MKREVAEAAGIDLKAGMRAFANNRIIYDRMLLGFPKDTHLQDLKEAFADGDIEKSVECADGLLKLTKKMGMLAYASTCEALLKALNDDLEKVDGLLEECQEHHDKAMTAFI